MQTYFSPTAFSICNVYLLSAGLQFGRQPREVARIGQTLYSRFVGINYPGGLLCSTYHPDWTQLHESKASKMALYFR